MRAPALFAAVVLMLSCQRGATPSSRVSLPSEAAAVREAWHYTAKVGARAATIDVELCFTGQPSELLKPSSDDAADYVDDVYLKRTGRRLPRVRGGSFRLDAVGPGDCVTYRVDLGRMGQREGLSRRVRWQGKSVIVQQMMWLWRPHRWAEDVEITMALELAEGVDASVPWTLTSGARGDRRSEYVLDPTVFRWLGYTAFGELEVQRFEVGGAKVEVARLQEEMACTRDGLRAWASDAVETSAELFGAYPREHLQVLVVPVDGGDGTVYFGMAGRGGGAGVYILMDTDAADDRLVGGWTTVHELLHHGMPFVADPWMGEGWVTYYTEVLRTRMGHRSEAEGWEGLWKGYRRGMRSRQPGTLRALSGSMRRKHAYQRVYWGGAAIALLLDVKMRLAGGKNFDDAMREVRRCCGDAREKLTAQEILEKLDVWYGEPIFTETANANLDAQGFPDVEGALSRLGISVDGAKVALDDDHAAAEHRRALMAADAPRE